eukprot:NODE_5082_length_245_cov_51.714286_g4411_i0.p2 GENE.NODE_5082_length_245_cov_51.714286_g4411_i0~~NODE_5082_length_245_cov_51.714286_g4411_i0.p2  ORF type:complete len:57 (-),score=15.73 NODE_5082_length_245_cov_51.714286_g4411_i0:45-215(-)
MGQKEGIDGDDLKLIIKDILTEEKGSSKMVDYFLASTDYYEFLRLIQDFQEVLDDF